MLVGLSAAYPQSWPGPFETDRFEHLGTEDGLSHFEAAATFQDDHGFLWIATNRGLNRYDGYQIETFFHDPQDPASLSDNFINALWPRPDGSVWIATSRGIDHLIPANGRIERLLSITEDAPLEWINAFLEHPDAGILAATSNGLFRLDLENRKAVRYADHLPLAGDIGFKDVLLEGRTIWANTTHGLLQLELDQDRVLSRRTIDLSRVLPPNPDNGPLLIDHRGTLWAGTWHGVIRRPRNGEFEFFELPGNTKPIFGFLEDRSGNLWISTHGDGLYVVDISRERVRNMRHQPTRRDSLAHSHVRGLLEDRHGQIWAATSKGVSKFDPSSWSIAVYEHVVDRPGLGGEKVRALLQTADGALWVAHDRGLDRFERNMSRVRNYRNDSETPGGFPATTIRDLEEDVDGSLWIGTDLGLFRFRPDGETFEAVAHLPPGEHSTGARRIGILRARVDGGLWIGTIDGLFLRRPDGMIRAMPGPNRVAVMALHEHEGFLWMGTDNLGLYKLDVESDDHRIFRADDASGLAHDIVAALHRDKRGTLWVGTLGGGLLRYESETERFVHPVKELESGAVRAIVEDSLGRLWLHDGGDLHQFDPQFDRLTTHDSKTLLPIEEFGLHNALRIGDELWFGGRGLARLHSWALPKSVDPPETVLTKIMIAGEEQSMTPQNSSPDQSPEQPPEISLGYRDRVVDFEIAALHLVAPQRNRIAYFLEGFDDSWNESGVDRRYARYTNLHPGRYALHIRGANRSGVWSEPHVAAIVDVQSPPWRTWWAYILYALAFALLVLILMRGHVRLRDAHREVRRLNGEQTLLIAELRDRNQELAEFQHSISHNLKNHVTTFAVYLDLVREESADGLLARRLQVMKTAADRMVRLLDGMLEYSTMGETLGTTQTFRIDQLFRRSAAELQDEIERRRVTVEIQEGMPRIWGEYDRLCLATLHLLDNAVKFSARVDPQVLVSAEKNERGVTVRIRDNGPGVPPRYADKIFELFEQLDPQSAGKGLGLALARRIIERHGGRLWYEEAEGGGSVFAFNIPTLQDPELQQPGPIPLPKAPIRADPTPPRRPARLFQSPV